MSWRNPTPFEQSLLEDTRSHWPEIIPLARSLSLAPRIEPLLLRNARGRFVPQAQAEVESRLWFSPLVAARSTREIVLHLGVAKALAEDLKAAALADLEALWQFTRRHTRHWSAEDRLERDLRYYALLDDRHRLELGLRDILRRIRAEDGEARQVELSRLVKRILPVIAPQGPVLSQAPDEARLLAQYAALALGDAGAWAQPGEPQALPPWLAAKLPEPISVAELGVEIRHDSQHGQVLHLIAAGAARAGERIAFPGPLPARLHVAGEGMTGTWYSVTEGSRIRISPPGRTLRLTALDGRQWDLRTEELPGGEGVEPGAPAPLIVAYVEADGEQARAIGAWLRDQGVPVELLAESAQPPTSGDSPPEARVVRLWTRAAQAFWADRPTEEERAVSEGLLLRTESVDPPATGVGPGRVLDWQDWSALDGSPQAEWLLRNLQRWREGGEIEPGPDTEAAVDDSARKPTYGDEIDALLAEIQHPETEPPRRLEIGDRLAELGDPRPGVGVIEIEVPEGEAVDRSDAQQVPPQARSVFPPEVRRLLDEIDDPDTEPPRRLEIGDELESLGDPRHGVGRDERGLPDIDWLEIGGGPFVYRDGEPRELPTFWIARYPTTNLQFQSFVDDGGYQEDHWWVDLIKPKPSESDWPQANRPRTNVDWYEAVAFSRWLTARLGLEEGAIRLPTEYEWEKAARGPEGLIYPWGNRYLSGFANIDETERKDVPWYLKQTTAVGLYPHGGSPYGVEDMAGTVWEWCLNKHKQRDLTAVDASHDARALRGGSWIDLSGDARADGRSGVRPDGRLNDGGFRVLSSVPIAVR